ncbi:MAG: TonB family protein [Stenotrophomonas sp.]|jgi:TonB family protein|uniref:energy transducer TonB n=1 Tax=Stenotrophomonas sp. TaxID=69392 RepID=UPI00283FB8A5|nr:TonB family protein [Stenotrophomonas sp.]MDR2961995.1 TonB family protein [Stenotrophomonas sp.]
MIILTALLAAQVVALPLPDCGRAAHKSAIALTESLIVKAAPLEIPYVEMGQGQGDEECVRLVFNISNGGAATDIEVAESSRDMIMNLAAIRALRKYTFKSASQGTIQTNTLVFTSRVGGEMPHSPNDH